MMRKLLSAVTVLLVMVCAVPVFAAQRDVSNATSSTLDGQAWLNSSQDEKLAFLLGADMMVASEQYIGERFMQADQDRKGKNNRPKLKMSPFARGWAMSYMNVSRTERVRQLDAYISSNASARQKPVFETIWYQFIEPNARGRAPR